jgi:hypothetical protein
MGIPARDQPPGLEGSVTARCQTARGDDRSAMPSALSGSSRYTTSSTLTDGGSGPGLSFEYRQDLLGHKSARITTHYSVAEISLPFDSAALGRAPAGSDLLLHRRLNEAPTIVWNLARNLRDWMGKVIPRATTTSQEMLLSRQIPRASTNRLLAYFFEGCPSGRFR